MQFGHHDNNNNDDLRPSNHKLHQACGIIVAPTTGDIAVNDIHTSQVNVYDNTGNFKFRLGEGTFAEKDKETEELTTTEVKGQMFHKSPRDVAVDSDNGNYFVTDESHYVKIYNSEGTFQDRFTVVSPEGETCGAGTWLAGLAIRNRVVYVGACNRSKFISKHDTLTGQHIGSFPVDALPLYLAATPLDTVVISSWSPNVVQIVDAHTGTNVRTVEPPTCVTQWRPTGICCSDDAIFVAIDNQAATDEYGVYCFSLSGDYVGCAIKNVTNPTGIAVSGGGGRTLMVSQYERGNPQAGCGLHGVKVFTRT